MVRTSPGSSGGRGAIGGASMISTISQAAVRALPDGFGQRLSVSLLTALPFELVHAELYVRRADGRLGFVSNLDGQTEVRQGACAWVRPVSVSTQLFQQDIATSFRIVAAF